MKKIYLMLISILLTANLVSGQEFPSELASELQMIIDDHISSTPFVGVAATVIYNDDSEWTGSAGTIDGSTAIDTSRLFDFGGQRHELMTATVLKMQEDGLLSIEDSIGDYLSAYDQINADIQIKTLLNHTSGLEEYWTGGTECWNEVFSDRGALWSLDKAAAYIPSSTAKTESAYNVVNTGSLVLALMVEAVSGNTVEEEVNSRVLFPLGLTNSIIPSSAFDEGVLNGVWNYNNGSPDYHGSLQQDAYITSRVGWCGKIHENARFTRALHTAQILNEENTEFLYSETSGSEEKFEIEDRDISVVFGNGVSMVSTDGDNMVGHVGNSLHSSMAFHYPELGFTVSLVSNAYNSSFELYSLFIEISDAVSIFDPYSAVSNFSQESLNLYPNPASDHINISLGNLETENVAVSILDMSGRTVRQIDLMDSYADHNSLRVPLSEDLVEGYYMIRLQTGSAVLAKPFILSR